MFTAWKRKEKNHRRVSSGLKNCEGNGMDSGSQQNVRGHSQALPVYSRGSAKQFHLFEHIQCHRSDIFSWNPIRLPYPSQTQAQTHQPTGATLPDVKKWPGNERKSSNKRPHSLNYRLPGRKFYKIWKVIILGEVEVLSSWALWFSNPSYPHGILRHNNHVLLFLFWRGAAHTLIKNASQWHECFPTMGWRKMTRRLQCWVSLTQHETIHWHSHHQPRTHQKPVICVLAERTDP